MNLKLKMNVRPFLQLKNNIAALIFCFMLLKVLANSILLLACCKNRIYVSFCFKLVFRMYY